MVSAPAPDQSNLAPIAPIRALQPSLAPSRSLPSRGAKGGRQSVGPLVATTERGRIELIDRLAPAWRALCAEVASEPFLHPDWLRTYLATRAPDARLGLVTVRAADGALTAVLPLIEERIRLAGVPLRRWRSIGDPHSPERSDLIVRPADRVAVATAVWDALRVARGWDLVELAAVPPGATALTLRDLAAAVGAPVASRVALTTPYIPLTDPATGEADLAIALAGVATKFKANLRRRLRNLEQLGPVRLVRVEHADQSLIERFLALEAAGWKGRNGTAIASRPHTDAFFRRMAQVAADNGWLTIYALLCADRPVAIHLGLTWPGADGAQIYGVPKLAYDETLAAYAPGHLLVGEILADLVTRGVAEFDFLANDAPWKRAWTDCLRPCERLFIFNPTPRPRLAHTLRFRLFPFARQKKLALQRRARTLRSPLSSGRWVGAEGAFVSSLSTLVTRLSTRNRRPT